MVVKGSPIPSWPRWFVMSRFALSFVVLCVATIHVPAQEALKGNDKTVYDDLKRFDNPPDTKDARAVLAKQAKFLVAPLSDPKRVDQMAGIIENAIRELPIQKVD